MLRMEQNLDTLSPTETKRYIHHYNFPPYSTGETGRVGSPKRREIGHGALAERALIPVIPDREDFPYAIRQVSEALGSNGSTSMGSVCASTLSLQDAGVPIKEPIAGIAMGLISGKDSDGNNKFATLTDILGDEDAYGDMDFKVAGTKDFVTAIQLDTKLDGIPASVLANALLQAKTARLEILDVLNVAISEPNSHLSKYAPQIECITIDASKIGDVIGPKGKNIQAIQEETATTLNVEDDGRIFIASDAGSKGLDKAKKMIDKIVNPYVPKVGDVFDGKVVSNAVFGSFVNLESAIDGLLHISEVRKMFGGEHIENLEKILPVGSIVKVRVKEIDRRGKVGLVAEGSFDNQNNHNSNNKKPRNRTFV
jgi:polyribonucleotide nucleotidyltransferase